MATSFSTVYAQTLQSDMLTYQDDKDAVIIKNLMDEYAKVSDVPVSLEVIKSNIKNLRAWGMPEDKLANVTIEEIREFIKELSTTGLQQEKDTADPLQQQIMKEKGITQQELVWVYNLGYTYDEICKMTYEEIQKYIAPAKVEYQNMINIAKEKGLSLQELSLLENTGLSYYEISKMPNEEIKDLLSKINPQSTKSSHTYYGTIPYFGESDNSCTFDSVVPISTSAIQEYCEQAMDYAEYVFNRTYNYASTKAGQNIRFSYFLYGEYDPGDHEGVDVLDAYSSHRDVKSAHYGLVVGTLGGSLGTVQIYDYYSQSTITYMHMDINDNLSIGDTVYVGDIIGQQDDVGTSNGNHLHTQVVYGTNTFIYPGTSDYTLGCNFPYYVLTWNI